MTIAYHCFFTLVLFALFIIGSTFGQSGWTPPTSKTYWTDSLIDHFDSQNTATFKQKYLVVDTHYKAGGPLFFYTGNEGPILSFYNNTGFVFELAPSFNALVVFAEHRYYGESLPFGVSDSFTRQNIKFLSIEQALADYALLIPKIKKQFSMDENTPVVSFGGSYGGMLTIFMRIRYPWVIHMGLAGSAPIVLDSGAPSIPPFFDTVTKDFGKKHVECPDLARQAFARFLELQEQQDWNTLSSIFHTCDPISGDKEAEHLMLWIINAFASMAMVDYPYPTNFLGNLPAWPMDVACDMVYASRGDPLQGLAEAAGLFYNGTNGHLSCFNISAEFIECADQTGCGSVGPNGWAWDYQACSEIIYFQDTNNVTDMFPPRKWTLEKLTDYCQARWGVTPVPGRLADLFGGANITFTSNLILSNGLLDPWHGGGVLESLSDTLPAVILTEGAHHLDLRHSDPRDPPSVTAARKVEKDYISSWLNDFKQQQRSTQ